MLPDDHMFFAHRMDVIIPPNNITKKMAKPTPALSEYGKVLVNKTLHP